MEPYYGPDGTLYVWTGTGYHAVPRVAAGDVGVAQTSDAIWSQGDSPYLIQDAKDLYGITNLSPYSSLSGLNANNQFALKGDNSQDAFSYWLKSGDKEGSEIKFVRDGDYYNPTFSGLQGWDTNDQKKSWVPLSIMLGGGALVASGVGAAGAAAGAAGAESGGLTMTGSAINPATYSMTPSAMMGDSLALSGVGAGSSIGGSSLGGLGEMWGKIPGPMQSQLIKGGMSVAGGLLGGGSGGSGMASGPRSIAPAITPKMYGEGASGGLLGANMGPMGPTETERRMRQQYMPSLLGGQNPWGY